VTAKRFAVLGNCQAPTVAACLRAWFPDAEIETHDLTEPGTLAQAEAIAARLDEADHVLAHPLEGARFGPLSRAALLARARPAILLPVVAFTGYQPDCVHLVARLDGPLAPYHSALAFAAFRLGLPPERCRRLFNAVVFRALGYFAERAAAEAALLRHGLDCGLDLAAPLAAWQAGGCFMHVPNHPRPGPVADVVRLALARAGLGALPPDACAAVPDRLARLPGWPVYPPIARRFGQEGEWRFRGTLRPGPVQEMLDFDVFLRRSHAAHAAAPEAALQAAAAESPRIQAALRLLPGLLAA
jgi:hypothetical protein